MRDVAQAWKILDSAELIHGEAEVDAAIAAVIAKTGAAGGKDMGKGIAALKAEYPGRIDFGKASGRVKAALG